MDSNAMVAGIFAFLHFMALALFIVCAVVWLSREGRKK